MYGQMGPQPGGFAEQAEMSSRPAFESIRQIVMAFQSVSMMLGSTYQALFSSFQAVIGVADQMSHMGSMFSTIAMLRRLRGFLAWMLGLVGITPPPFLIPDPDLEGAFGPDDEGEDENAPRTWPIMMFFAIAIGGPYLIYKLLKSSAGNTNDKRKPVKARAAHPYQAQSRDELSFQVDDMLTVYPPEQMNAYPQGWVMAALRGQRGLVPQNHLRLQRQQDLDPTPSPTEDMSQVFNSAAPAPPIDHAWGGLPEEVGVVATPASAVTVATPTLPPAQNQRNSQSQRQNETQNMVAPQLQTGHAGSRARPVSATPLDWTASFAPPQQHQQQQSQQYPTTASNNPAADIADG